jgi:hypothetical protein
MFWDDRGITQVGKSCRDLQGSTAIISTLAEKNLNLSPGARAFVASPADARVLGNLGMQGWFLVCT